eukprot:8661493-Heterocapsa_arctica.AAC.1
MPSSRDLREAPANHAPAPRNTSLPTLFRKSWSSDSLPMRAGSRANGAPEAATGTRTSGAKVSPAEKT